MGLMLGEPCENGWRIGVFRAEEGLKRMFVGTGTFRHV